LKKKNRKNEGLDCFLGWDLQPGEKTGKTTFWGNGACLVKTWRLGVRDFRRASVTLGMKLGVQPHFAAQHRWEQCPKKVQLEVCASDHDLLA
jgi:hypothetical protein